MDYSITRLPDSLFLLWDFQLFQMRDEVFAGAAWLDGLVDGGNLPRWIDVEGPAPRELTLGWSVGGNHAVRERDFFVWVGEQRKVGVLFLGERLVVRQRIDADHEVRGVELPNHSPALPERVAFSGSTGGERLREPRQRDPSPLEILAEGVGLAVGGLKGEVRGLIADLELGRRCLGSG